MGEWKDEAAARRARSGSDLRAADRSRRKRSTRFKTVRAALSWYYERREVMTSPQGMHPRTETARGGQQVCVSVDGGRGGDLDGTLVDLATIGQLLGRLEETHPYHHLLLVLHFRGEPGDEEAHPLSQQMLAARWQTNQTQISRDIGRALFHLEAGLRGAGLLPVQEAA